MHERRAFDLRTLIDRHDETRQAYVGNVREPRLNFLALVERRGQPWRRNWSRTSRPDAVEGA
jgi:hypothetical protein